MEFDYEAMVVLLPIAAIMIAWVVVLELKSQREFKKDMEPK